MDKLDTDAILDVAKHIEESKKPTPEFLCDHGLEFNKVLRALQVMVPGGEGRLEAAQAGFLIGLQLGAMRLDPLPWEPPPEGDKPPCNCIICSIERMMEQGGGGESV